MSDFYTAPPLDDSIQPTKLGITLLPELEFAFQSRVQVIPEIRTLGDIGGMGVRKMLTIVGGDFEGPRLRGKVLAGGGDWPLIRPDKVGIVDARYTLQTDDGVFINIVNTGFRHGPEEVISHLESKQGVPDPAAYYLRTYTRFESPTGRYDWLNKHVFIGLGERHPKVLFLRYYLLK